MFWRVPSTGKAWQTLKGKPNERAFRKLIEQGKATGLLAFQGDGPVGWCSVGPRTDFAYLSRARKIPPAPDDKTWSVTCFFIDRGARRSGVASALLEAAVGYARARKASWLEGYPVVIPADGGGKAPDTFSWTGVPPLFEKAGFKKAADAGSRRIYRRRLT